MHIITLDTCGCPSGDGVEEPDAGVPAEWSAAASRQQPGGERSLSNEPALPAAAAGWQDLRTHRAAGHSGQAGGDQLEVGGRIALTCLFSRRGLLPPPPPPSRLCSEQKPPACRHSHRHWQVRLESSVVLQHVHDTCSSMFTELYGLTLQTHPAGHVYKSQVSSLCLGHAFPPLAPLRNILIRDFFVFCLSELHFIWGEFSFCSFRLNQEVFVFSFGAFCGHTSVPSSFPHFVALLKPTSSSAKWTPRGTRGLWVELFLHFIWTVEGWRRGERQLMFPHDWSAANVREDVQTTWAIQTGGVRG